MKIYKRIIAGINGLNYFITYSGKINKKKSNVILFLHGFPELAYSYRYLLKYFAKEGYYCIAPDQRGYGKTKTINDSKNIVTHYSIFNLTKDIYSLLFNLGIMKVHIVGHDFGSYVAGYFTLLYPNYVKSIAIMSMPFSAGTDDKVKFDIRKINKNLKSLRPAKKHYQVYFSGKTANKNMTYCKQGVFNFLRAYYHFKSYDYEKNKPHELINSSLSQLTKMPEYYIMSNNLGMAQTVKKYMPSQSQIKKCLWLSDNDLKVYADSFIKNSFQGPLNWYKMMLSKKENKNIKNLSLPNYITLPCIFLAGKADWGIYQKPWQLNNMKKLFKNFYGTTIIENAGHWVQQEQPKKTFEAINNFYKRIS